VTPSRLRVVRQLSVVNWEGDSQEDTPNRMICRGAARASMKYVVSR